MLNPKFNASKEFIKNEVNYRARGSWQRVFAMNKSKNMLAKEVMFDVHGGGDGYLVALEGGQGVVPFDVKRVYYIYDVGAGLRRGFHAHKKLKQLLVCVSGSCVVDLDNTFERKSFVLDRPDKGLLIEEPLWREIYDFSSDCVLMVLASEHYDTEDYIWKFKDYVNYINCM